MNPQSLVCDGWDRIEGPGGSATFIRMDRRAKLTVAPVSLAFEPDGGWMAKLWMTDQPHAPFEYVSSVVHSDPEAFLEGVQELTQAAGAWAFAGP